MPHLTVLAAEAQLAGHEDTLITALTDAVTGVYGDWARPLVVIRLVGVPTGRWAVGGVTTDNPAPEVAFGIRAGALARPDGREIARRLVATVTDLLTEMLRAIRGANALTLITGILVLAGALSAGLSARLYEAVVLKTYGATRIELIQAFIIEYAILGLASAVFGVTVGALGSWFLSFWILEMPWVFSWGTALLTALLAMVLSIAAGLMVTWRALSAKPAPILRDE